MLSRLLGPILAMGISLSPSARAAQFIALDDPENPVLQSVARQLVMGTSSSFPIGPSTQIVVFFFQNIGPVTSVIDGIFFDTTRSGIPEAISVDQEPIGEILFRTIYPAEPLPGAGGVTPSFVSVLEASAVPPITGNGINNDTQGREVLFLWAGMSPVASEQLSAALSGANGKPLRVGIHVSSIAGYKNGGSATFILDNFTSPIPEPASWASLLAGLGLMVAWSQRRQARSHGKGADYPSVSRC